MHKKSEKQPRVTPYLKMQMNVVYGNVTNNIKPMDCIKRARVSLPAL